MDDAWKTLAHDTTLRVILVCIAIGALTELLHALKVPDKWHLLRIGRKCGPIVALLVGTVKALAESGHAIHFTKEMEKNLKQAALEAEHAAKAANDARTMADDATARAQDAQLRALEATSQAQLATQSALTAAASAEHAVEAARRAHGDAAAAAEAAKKAEDHTTSAAKAGERATLMKVDVQRFKSQAIDEWMKAGRADKAEGLRLMTIDGP